MFLVSPKAIPLSRVPNKRVDLELFCMLSRVDRSVTDFEGVELGMVYPTKWSRGAVRTYIPQTSGLITRPDGLQIADIRTGLLSAFWTIFPS